MQHAIITYIYILQIIFHKIRGCSNPICRGTTTSSPGISLAFATASSGVKAGRFLGTPTPNLGIWETCVSITIGKPLENDGLMGFNGI